MIKKRAERQVKIYPEDVEWILNEQERIRLATGEKPSQPELISALIREHRGDLAYQTVRRRPARDQQWHDALDQVLNSSQREGIEANLRWALRFLAQESTDTRPLDEQVREKFGKAG